MLLLHLSQASQILSGIACLYVAWSLRKARPYLIHFFVLGTALLTTGLIGSLVLADYLTLAEANDLRRPLFILERFSLASLAFIVLGRVKARSYVTQVLERFTPDA